MTDKPKEPLLENGELEASELTKDMFSRPSGFRVDVIKSVWDKAPNGPEEDTKLDWRNGIKVGPWKFGESRADVWDMGHIVAWYKVVEELKTVEGITRKDVLDEFNDIDNLGVEDPASNRELGVNSRRAGVHRLPEPEAESILFNRDDAALTAEEYRAQVAEKESNMKERVARLAEAKAKERAEMADKNGKAGRVIVWDTETTGLSPARGDKILDLAAVEYVDGKPTGREFHQVIDPQRDIPSGATRVHGINNETVKGKPIFADVADSFLEFIGDAPLVAHNARFDMTFINAELEAIGKPAIEGSRSIDSLRLARTVLPGNSKYDLDSLAEHFGVDHSSRHPFHSAITCSRVLGEVFEKLEGLAKEQGVPLQNVEAANARLADGFEAAAKDQAELNAARVEANVAKSSFADRVRESRAQTSELAR